VTAVLRDLLTNGLIDHAPPGMGDAKVTALPPTASPPASKRRAS
jgi:hypothetical protein